MQACTYTLAPCVTHKIPYYLACVVNRIQTLTLTHTHTEQAQSHAELLLVMCHCLPVSHRTSSPLQSHVHSHLITFLRTGSSTSTFITQRIPQHITGSYHIVKSVASVESNQENSQCDSETFCISSFRLPTAATSGRLGNLADQRKRRSFRSRSASDAERSTSTVPFKLSKMNL